MSKLRKDAGQALVIVGLSMVVLLSFMGLVIDLGYMRYVRRQMQILADASAMAGAREVVTCQGTANCPALQTAAQKAMDENGITSYTAYTGSGNCSLTPPSGSTYIEINNGPACASTLGFTDPHAGNANYVEVIVAQSVPTIFAQIFGVKSLPITARGEAGLVGEGTSAALLGTGAGPDLTMKGGDTINAGGGLYSNASLSCNGNTTINTPTLQIGAPPPAGCTATGGTTTTSALPVSDPLAYLQPPCSGNGCGACTNVGSVTTLSPGTYCGISGGNIAFSAGTYIIEGTLAPKNSTWTGTGVTFFLTGTTSHPYGGLVAGSNAVLGSASVPLSAPTSGNYSGMLFWQDPNAVGVSGNDSSFKANDTCDCRGVFYFPTTSLTLTGGTGAEYAVVVAQSLSLKGNVTLGISSSLAGGGPLKMVTLGE